MLNPENWGLADAVIAIVIAVCLTTIFFRVAFQIQDTIPEWLRSFRRLPEPDPRDMVPYRRPTDPKSDNPSETEAP